MFVSKNIEVNKIKDDIYKRLKDRFPSIRFGIKYFPKTDKQDWDWVIINILTKGVKESDLREIDNLCVEMSRMHLNKPTNEKGIVDYVESEYDMKPINQFSFL